MLSFDDDRRLLAQLLAVSAAVLMMALKPGLPTIALVSAAAFGLSTVRPALGLGLWVMVMPLESHMLLSAGRSPFSLLTPALLVGTACHYLVRGQPAVRADAVLLVLALLTVGLLSTLTGGEVSIDGLRVLLSITILCTVAVLAGFIIRSDQRGLWIIGHATILAVLMAAALGIMFNQVAWRLTVGDNVRQLANVAGIATAILLGAFLVPRQSATGFRLPYDRHHQVRLLLTVVFIALLAATISRGVLLALAVACCAGLVVALGLIRGRLDLAALRRVAFLLSAVAVAAVLSVTYIDRVVTGGKFVLRVMLAVSSADENLRWQIWSAALSQMAGSDWVIGAGPGAFRGMVQASNLDFYAHSVYIDTLVSLGLAGVVVLGLFVARIGVTSMRHDNTLGMVLFTYLLLSFATHGSLTSKPFWLTLGLAYGVSLSMAGRRPTRGPAESHSTSVVANDRHLPASPNPTR